MYYYYYLRPWSEDILGMLHVYYCNDYPRLSIEDKYGPSLSSSTRA